MSPRTVAEEAAYRLERLEQVFDLLAFDRNPRPGDVRRYYQRSALAFALVHSSDGAVHVALNADGEFDPRGYSGQPEHVARWIGSGCRSILELGCGPGFNLAYLASQHPEIAFTGVDLAPKHIRSARRRLQRQGLRNVGVVRGDFQALSFGDGEFDLAFAVESLSHAHEPRKALEEIRRVLRPGAHLVVIDQWRTPGVELIDPSIRRAAALTEACLTFRSMRLHDWTQAAKTVGFQVLEDCDLSDVIIPNLLRFERLAARFLARPRLARASVRILPTEMMANAVVGYLWPLSISGGAHTYRAIVLRSGV